MFGTRTLLSSRFADNLPSKNPDTHLANHPPIDNDAVLEAVSVEARHLSSEHILISFSERLVLT
jgi:hypothetical protein